jgi:hypothetical protein
VWIVAPTTTLFQKERKKKSSVPSILNETGVMATQASKSININKDLFVLGKVVSALSEHTKAMVSRILYPDSKKLT